MDELIKALREAKFDRVGDELERYGAMLTEANLRIIALEAQLLTANEQVSLFRQALVKTKRVERRTSAREIAWNFMKL